MYRDDIARGINNLNLEDRPGIRGVFRQSVRPRQDMGVAGMAEEDLRIAPELKIKHKPGVFARALDLLDGADIEKAAVFLRSEIDRFLGINGHHDNPEKFMDRPFVEDQEAQEIFQEPRFDDEPEEAPENPPAEEERRVFMAQADVKPPGMG